jgi:hypothetical protein
MRMILAFLQLYAASYFKEIDVRVGDTPIPDGMGIININTRQVYSVFQGFSKAKSANGG